MPDIFLIQKADKLKIENWLALLFRFKNLSVFSTFLKLVEKMKKASVISPGFPLHLVKRAFLFLEKSVLRLEIRRFKKYIAYWGVP